MTDPTTLARLVRSPRWLPNSQAEVEELVGQEVWPKRDEYWGQSSLEEEDIQRLLGDEDV